MVILEDVKSRGRSKPDDIVALNDRDIVVRLNSNLADEGAVGRAEVIDKGLTWYRSERDEMIIMMEMLKIKEGRESDERYGTVSFILDNSVLA